MRCPRLHSSIRLLLAIFALLGAARAEAQLQPSSDVLLPYFEVDMQDGGTTTTFTLGNSLDRTVDVRVDVYTNWGISVLTVPVTLQPYAVLSVDLRDWLFGGKLPSRVMVQAEAANLQAVLCGERSPKDKLYYSTEVTPHRAVGYVTFRTQGQRPDALWGDYFVNDPGQESSQGDTLVNIDTTTGCPGLCQRHLLRYLTDAKDVDADTRVVIWTGRTGQPSANPKPGADGSTTADTLAFNDKGLPIDTRQLPVLPVQRVTVGELGLSAHAGWLDLQTDVPAFVGVFYGSDNRHSVALQAYCAPLVLKAGPGVRLQKRTNGQVAPLPPGPSIPVGSPVTWEYEVENTGDVALSDIEVTDDQGVVVKCPQDELEPGESMVCTGKGTAVACQYTNTGKVTARPDAGPVVSAEDVSHYFGLHNATIDVETLVNGDDADAVTGPMVDAGAPVAFTYVVKNTGAVRLADIQVTDDQGIAVSCPRTMLKPGESMTCTAGGKAAEGQHANVGAVSGNPPCGPAVTDSDPGHYYGRKTDTPAPKIDIEKHTNGEDADAAPGPEIAVGAPVLWEYFVTNTGDVRLTNVRVTDDKGVVVSCPQTALDPGAAMRCTGNGTAVEGQYANVGTVTGTSPQGKTVTDSDPSHYYGRKPESPKIDIEKHTNGEDADAAPGPEIAVGAPVLWEYFVTNTGDVRLTNVRVTDDKGVVVSCPLTALDPGAAMRCTGNGTATAGQYVNLGTVTGTSPKGVTVTDSDPSHYYGRTPPPVVTGNQGCTPGYWKNHTDSWPPTGYSPSQKAQSVFQRAAGYPSLGGATLLQALAFQGGSTLEGAAGNLLRAAVAGLLDAAHPNVKYPRDAAQLIQDVDSALASNDRDTMLSLASAIDRDNNLGCPLN